MNTRKLFPPTVEPQVSSASISQDYEIQAATSGPLYLLVEAQQKQAPRRAGLWLFDKNWRLLGQVSGIPPRAEQEIGITWDQAGQRAAIFSCSSFQTGVDLGLLQPPSLHLQSILRLKHATNNTQVLWSKDKLIIASMELLRAPRRRRNNVFLELNLTTRKLRQIYREDATLPGHNTVESAYLSPDNAYIAFDRMAYTPDTQFGISLLALSNGKCVQLTSENADHYYHGVVKWEKPDTLVFIRRNRNGGWDLYRAYLKPRR